MKFILHLGPVQPKIVRFQPRVRRARSNLRHPLSILFQKSSDTIPLWATNFAIRFSREVAPMADEDFVPIAQAVREPGTPNFEEVLETLILIAQGRGRTFLA